MVNKKRKNKIDSGVIWWRIILSFFILGIIFSLLGPTGFLFPGLFLFALIFRFVLKVNWGESFKLGLINIIFNGAVTIMSLILFFSGLKLGYTISIIYFVGGILITKLFLNSKKLIIISKKQ